MSTADPSTDIQFVDIHGTAIRATRIVSTKRTRGHNSPHDDTFEVTFVKSEDTRPRSTAVSYLTYSLLRAYAAPSAAP